MVKIAKFWLVGELRENIASSELSSSLVNMSYTKASSCYKFLWITSLELKYSFLSLKAL